MSPENHIQDHMTAANDALEAAEKEADHYKSVYEKVSREYGELLLELRTLTDQIDMNRDEFIRHWVSLKKSVLET